jgi:hypothetical protein
MVMSIIVDDQIIIKIVHEAYNDGSTFIPEDIVTISPYVFLSTIVGDF